MNGSHWWLKVRFCESLNMGEKDHSLYKERSSLKGNEPFSHVQYNLLRKYRELAVEHSLTKQRNSGKYLSPMLSTVITKTYLPK